MLARCFAHVDDLFGPIFAQCGRQVTRIQDTEILHVGNRIRADLELWAGGARARRVNNFQVGGIGRQASPI